MPLKPYNIPEKVSNTVAEPAVAYLVSRDEAFSVSTEVSSSNVWNPNAPFHGTQEEWWEHFHRIEEGNFDTWEEHQKKFYAWKKEYHASRMK